MNSSGCRTKSARIAASASSSSSSSSAPSNKSSFRRSQLCRMIHACGNNYRHTSHSHTPPARQHCHQQYTQPPIHPPPPHPPNTGPHAPISSSQTSIMFRARVTPSSPESRMRPLSTAKRRITDCLIKNNEQGQAYIPEALNLRTGGAMTTIENTHGLVSIPTSKSR